MATTIETTTTEGGSGFGGSLAGWALRESPYIIMLVLGLVGVMFQMDIGYWAILTPVFALISIIAGWRRVPPEEGRMQMAGTLALSWLGLIMAIVVLYSSGVRGVMVGREQSLGIMTLLALGTFTAGAQARVWQFCVVAILLYIAVLALGWMGRSPLIVVVGIIVVIGAGTLAWWVDRRAQRRVL